MLRYSLFEVAYLGFLILALLVTATYAITTTHVWRSAAVFIGAVLIGLALNKGLFLNFSDKYLGNDDYSILNFVVLAACTAGVALGACTKAYLDKGKLRLKVLLPPFLMTPLLILPLVPKVTENIDTGFWGVVTIACLAYQSGYFWTDVMQKGVQETR